MGLSHDLLDQRDGNFDGGGLLKICVKTRVNSRDTIIVIIIIIIIIMLIIIMIIIIIIVIIPVVVGALEVIKKGSEKFVTEIPGNINLWHIFYGRSYPSSDNKDEATVKCPRLKVCTRPLEKKNGLMS